MSHLEDPKRSHQIRLETEIKYLHSSCIYSTILLIFYVQLQVEVIGIEKNEASAGQRSAPGKGPGHLLFEKHSSLTRLAAQLGTVSSQRSVDSISRQNLASAIEQHGSGRKSLSESSLVDPNSVSGNVSLRKQFHNEEEHSTAVKMAKNLEDGNSSSLVS